jgi:hypothetical protein
VILVFCWLLREKFGLKVRNTKFGRKPLGKKEIERTNPMLESKRLTLERTCARAQLTAIKYNYTAGKILAIMSVLERTVVQILITCKCMNRLQYNGLQVRG